MVTPSGGSDHDRSPVAPGRSQQAIDAERGALAEVTERLADDLESSGASSTQRRLYRSMITTVAGLAAEGTEVIDLKLADSALAEMAEAFRIFRPFRKKLKVTIFGSARTEANHPAYDQARDLAAAMAEAGWMVVTGAGPGIMAAGMEGAGRERSIGVNIRLPQEQGANPFIAPSAVWMVLIANAPQRRELSYQLPGATDQRSDGQSHEGSLTEMRIQPPSDTYAGNDRTEIEIARRHSRGTEDMFRIQHSHHEGRD